MPKLTKTYIESLTPPERGQVIHRDSELPGFGVRLTQNCKSYIIEGIVNGVRRRLTIGRVSALQIGDARRAASKILIEMQLGIHPYDRKNDPSLEEVLHKYSEEAQIKSETLQSQRRMIIRCLNDWMDLPISSITKEMIQNRHRSLVRVTRCGTDNKTSANSCMITLRRLMNFANANFETNGKAVLPENPVSKAMKWRWFNLNVRQGIIPDHKLAAFYNATMSQPSKIARDYLLILLFTSLRRNEVLCIRWKNVDFDNRTILIPAEDNKSGRDHVLPMSDFVCAVLQSRKDLHSTSDFVFPGRDSGHLNEPRAVLARLRKEMGWHWLIHDLRRTCLSIGEKTGAPYLALKAIAGHVLNKSVTERYIIVDEQYTRPYMEAISSRLLKLMGKGIEDWKLDDKAAGVLEPFNWVNSTKRPQSDPDYVGVNEEPEEFYW